MAVSPHFFQHIQRGTPLHMQTNETLSGGLVISSLYPRFHIKISRRSHLGEGYILTLDQNAWRFESAFNVTTPERVRTECAVRVYEIQI